MLSFDKIKFTPELKGKPTILQVLPALKSGGVENTTLEIARAIVDAGGISLVASAPGPLVEKLEASGATHIPLPLESRNPFTIYRNIKRLVHVIRTHHVNLVHARSRAPGWSAYGASLETHTPFMTTYHAPYGGTSLFKRLYNSVMARGQRVIAISQFIGEHIISRYEGSHWFDAHRIRLVHEGIDLERFHKASKARMDALRKEWNIDENCRVIILPGRLTRWKGQPVMIKALASLKSPNVVCVIVGSDQGRTAYRQELMDLAKQLNVTDKLRLVDHCADMPAAFGLATLMVSASTDPEGFGLVMAEAQAMGLPVVATRHGAALEVVLDGESGWFVTPGDALELASTLDHALSLPQQTLSAMGDAGRAHVEATFSKDLMYQKTLGIYAELLGER